MEGPDGTTLAPDLAEATVRRLEACLVLPRRCQARLDALGAICAVRVEGASDVGRADCLVARVEDSGRGGRWSTLEVVVLTVAAALASGGAGVVAGLLLR